MNEQPVKVERDWQHREGCTGPMTAERASYFLERFKREEKMLGPHEQWALDYALSSLRTAPDEVERVAQDWLDRTFGVPEDRDYSADEMVDAFIAGAALRAAPLPDRAGEMREAVARIIDPFVWDEADNYRERAEEWFAKGRTGPRDPLTYGYRQKAHHMQAELLAKADQILALRPSQGDREWRGIESAPHACHVLACRFDEVEWVYAVVASPPIYPFTHWMPLPSSPTRQPEGE